MARSSTTHMVRDAARELVADLRARGAIIGSVLATLWSIHVVNALIFGGALFGYGIRPWTVDGLWGIAFAPFLHHSFAHLISNSVGFVWLAPMVMLRRRTDLARVSAYGAAIGGVGTWLVGGVGTTHAGFSGVLFAYLGFLLARGWFERSVGAVLVSALTAIGFGSMLWGLLPLTPGVSWQGHLFGFIGGVVAARGLAPRRRR